MKTARNSIALITIMLVAVALAFASSDRSRTRVTVGDFVRDLMETARSSGAKAGSGRLVGIDIAMSTNAPLTEAGAAALLKQTGFQASSSNPDRALNRQQADILLGQFRTWLVVHTLSTGASGRTQFPANSVEECFQERNHGQCVDCCKSLGGSASTCSKACMVINKPSESEPLP
jgi:hypothetical protein